MPKIGLLTTPCGNKRSPYSLGVIRYGSVSSDFSVNPRPPNAPGVYMFLGADDRILYVGMAHDLEKVLYRYKGLKGRKKFRDRLAASEFGRVAWSVASQSETPATLERIAITRFRPARLSSFAMPRSTSSRPATWPRPKLTNCSRAQVEESAMWR